MNDREKTAIRLLVEYRHEARKLGWGCDSLDAEATKVIESAVVDSEPQAVAAEQRIAASAPQMLNALRNLVETIEKYAEWASRERVADPAFNQMPLRDLILESVRSHGALDDALAAIATAAGVEQ